MLATESRTRVRHWDFISPALIFVVTLFVYYSPYRAHGLCGVGYESLQLACSLAKNGTFSDPFQTMPTGPSAHLAPLHPAYVALLIKLFGETTFAGFVLGWSAIVVIGLHLAYLPFLARHLTLGFGAGVVASVLFLLSRIPPFIVWETFYVALLAMVLSWLMYNIVSGPGSFGRILITAVLWGALLWMAAMPLLVMLAWLIWVFVATKIPVGHKLALLIIPFLVVSPWLLRNYRTFHHFVFMRDNLGLELAVSNNLCADFRFVANEVGPCFASNHPNEGKAEAQRVRDLGEYEYNQVRMHEALSWIKTNPKAFLSLTERRFISFWFPSPTGNPFAARGTPYGILVWWFATFASIPGLWLMWKRNRNAAGIILLWLFFFPPIYYLVQYDVRYRCPILWATFLPAGYLIIELSKNMWTAFRPNS
jgi:hypothetical protein